MRFRSLHRRVWLCAVLVLGMGRVAMAAANEPRLDANVSPSFEAVNLAIDADQESYTGSVRIELHVQKAASDFLFHAEEMTLDSVELTGPAGAIPVTVADAGDRGTRRVTTTKPLAPGNYTLSISFSKPYNTKAVGLYRVLSEGHAYLFTQFEAMDARKAFPCWDEPCFKIPYQMTLTIPTQHEAISNTPVEKETIGATTRTLQFKKTRPLPSYLIAIAEGPIESVAVTGLPFPAHVWAPKGQKNLGKYAASITPGIVKALEGYFGTPYPFEKLDLVAVPEFWPGAMENAGMITFRDRILLVDTKTTSTRQQQRMGYIAAHELAHMWFGDYVTMAWWDDLWLNESFADWLSEKVAKQLYPDSDAETEDLAEVNATMTQDARASTTPVRKKVDSGNDVMEDVGLAYQKGAHDPPHDRSIHRRRRVPAWCAQLSRRARVEKRAGVRSVRRAVGRGRQGPRADPGKLSRSPRLPARPGRRGQGRRGHALAEAVSQLRRQSGRRHVDRPVRLKVSDGKNVQTRVVLLDKPTKSVEVGGNVEWVMPDEGGVGYYRWIVPVDMMVKIASDPTRTLSKPERVRFLGNARALLDAGEITGSEYLAIAASFANTPEPEIVTAVIEDLQSLRVPFITDDLEGPYANYVRRALGAARDRYGIEPRPDDSEVIAAMRPDLIQMLGREGRDPEVIAYCKTLAKKYMDDPSSVDASIAGAALGIAMMDGTQAQFDDIRMRYEKSTAPVEKSRYLSAMGRFEDPKIQDQLLAYALTDKVRPTDIWQLVGGVGATDHGREKIFEWMRKNYDRLASRVPVEFVAYYPYFAGGCSEQRLAAAKEFFSEPDHRVDGTDATLQKVGDQIEDCVNLREREGQAVAAYLRDLPSAP